MKPKPALDYIFHPKSYAIVGISDSIFNHGYIVIKELIDGGYKGKIYPVHPKLKEILGIKCYEDIREIQGDVDYVFVGIKASSTPALMKACAEKGVRVCHFFASGFSELGSEEGKKLEEEVLKIARTNNIRIIGPNSMGVYCPASGIYYASGLDRVSGTFGLLSQSGGNLIYLSRAASTRGVPVSKAVSYGNGIDIDESDLLEYFADDDDTAVIGAYIEGVKDTGRFRRALKKAAGSKPAIIYKSGKTELGAITAASHTGAMSGSINIWDAAIRQDGAIHAESIDEVVDLSLLFTYMKPPGGRRIGIVGIGGGLSVMAADVVHRQGLELPPLPDEVKKKLTAVLPNAGSIFTNPVDTSVLLKDPGDLKKTIEILSNWDDIDFVFIHHAYEIIGWSLDLLIESGLSAIVGERLTQFARGINKPVVIILHYVVRPQAYQLLANDQAICLKAGFPVFTSIDSAAKAMNKFISYHERKQRLPGN